MSATGYRSCSARIIPLLSVLAALAFTTVVALTTAAAAQAGGAVHFASQRAHGARSPGAHGARRHRARNTTTHAKRRAKGRQGRRDRHKPTAPRPTTPAPGPSSSPKSPAPKAPESPAPVTTSGTPVATPSVPEASSGGSGPHSAPTPPVVCELYAAPTGSDTSGNGSIAKPYQSVVKLDRALAPGETGCLRGGTYGSTGTYDDLGNNGTAAGQITITAYPGETATVDGWVDVEASYTTIAGLQIDGSNTFYNRGANPQCPGARSISQGLDLNGTGDVFERNNFYESVASLRGTGIGVGFWGDADNTTIRYNRIHEVGQCLQYEHLIYLASGNNVQIYDNWMYDDHNGWGVSVYPHATNARIFSNVIDGAGSGLAIGDNGSSVDSGNEAWHNVVASSVNVPGAAGHPLQAALVECPELDSSSVGNEVFENDSFENPDGVSAVNKQVSAAQLSVRGNITVDPQFVNAAADDFDVAATSPVASWGLWNGS